MGPWYYNEGYYQMFAGGSPIASSLNGRFITPIDIVHFCLENDTTILAPGPNQIDCGIINSNCTGMWVGDKDGSPVIPSAYSGQIGPISYDGTEFYNLNFPNAPSPAAAFIAAADIYFPALGGSALAQNNCNGPQNACDDEWYNFGCNDVNAFNFNELLDLLIVIQ